MVGINYVDFDVTIESIGKERYRVKVTNSPVGEATNEFSKPFSSLELENFLLRIGRTRRGVRRRNSPEMEAAKSFGERLFNAAFGGDMWACLRSSLNETAQRKMGLRIRLRLTDAPDLIHIPWEYLYNPWSKNFLTLSVKTPVVRYTELPERVAPLTVALPLRILAVIASPTDEPELDVEQEWAKLIEALGDLLDRGYVILERLNKPTLAALRRKLRQGEYHVFHFIGHGSFDKQAEEGVLIFENEAKRSHSVRGQILGIYLESHYPMRLVVLNACEGARTSSSDPFAGTAQALVLQGIPAVIAMQFEITDKAAITFAHEIYSAIADGYPIDAALAVARQGILALDNDVEWGTPVLYLRSPDGRIFDIGQVSAEERKRLQISALSREVETAIARQDWAAAQEKLQVILKIDPNHIEAAAKLRDVNQEFELTPLYIMGQKHYEARRWVEALKHFHQVQERKSTYKDIATLIAATQQEIERDQEEQWKRAQIYALYQEAHTAMDGEAWATAIEKLNALLALDPTHAEAGAKLNVAQQQQNLAQLYARGVEHFEAGQLSEALAEFRQIQEIESSYKDIETYLATTQWALAKKQEEDQTRSQVSILCCEAEIAMANEDWSTAIEKQQAILVLIPNDQGTIFRLSSARCQREMFLLYESGKQHYEAGRYREALNEFDQIQQKESDYRDVNQLVALVQSDLKKEEAERQAKIAKHYSDALAAIDKEEWAVAMNELQTYLALNPDHIAAAEILSYVRQEQEFSNLYDKGQDHYNAERWDEALSCFQQIQDIKGEYKDAAFLISNAQSQIAKARERERAQSRITLLFREVTSDLAEERWAVAIEKLHAILALDPDHTDAKAELSEAQRQQKLAQMYKQGVAHFEAGRLNEALAELSQVKSTKGTFKNIENLISAIQDKLEKKEKEEPQRTHSAGMPKQSTERIPLPHTNATPEPRQVAHRSLLIIGAGLALVVLVIVIIKFGRQKGSSPIGTLLGVITSLLRVDEVALSPDGLILAVTGEDEAVGLWRVSDHSLIRTLTGRASSGRCVAMSPKGDIVASGAEDGNIYLWQKSDGRLLNTLQSHKNYVFFVSFSEDGEVLFSASYDKTIRMWRVNDGKLLSSITISPQESIITINPDKRIVALYGQNNGVWLRSAVDGKLLETLEGNGYVVKCGAFSPDGQFLALGSTDGAVRLWRTSNGSLVSTVQGEEIKVGSVVFSPDGQKVTAGWGNGVIRLWQISNTNFVKVLEGHTMNVQSIAFNKTGDILASASDDKTIRLWQIKEGGK